MAELVEAKERQDLTRIIVAMVPWARQPGACPSHQLLQADPGTLGDTSSQVT